MNTIHIPDSIDEAVNQLGGVERLLTAKRWERSAIVAAFVEPGEQHDNGSTETSSRLSPGQFAAHGIAGLRTKDTVRLYAQRWLDAHDGIHPEPGADVLLPDDTEWQPTRTGTNGTSSVEGATERLVEMANELDPAAVAAAIEASAPEIANAVIEMRDRPKPKPEPVPAGDPAVHDRMDTEAMIGTALGHATAIKLRHDSKPDSFEPDVDVDKLDRLSSIYSAMADLVRGIDSDELTALLDRSGR